MKNAKIDLFRALTARDLMNPRVISLRDEATVREAADLFLRERFSGAPVINEAGRAIGVITLKDIARYASERLRAEEEDEAVWNGTRRPPGEGLQIDRLEGVTVRQVMTPFVQFVTPEAGLVDVLLAFRGGPYHRVFVVDPGHTIIGVISTVDVLRRLEDRLRERPERRPRREKARRRPAAARK